MRDPNGIGSREFLLKCSNSILIESNSIFSKVHSTIFLLIDTVDVPIMEIAILHD